MMMMMMMMRRTWRASRRVCVFVCVCVGLFCRRLVLCFGSARALACAFSAGCLQPVRAAPPTPLAFKMFLVGRRCRRLAGPLLLLRAMPNVEANLTHTQDGHNLKDGCQSLCQC